MEADTGRGSARSAAMSLAAEAWLAITDERWADAETLADRALKTVDGEHGDVQRDVVQGLASVIATICQGRHVDHPVLDRVRHHLLGPSAHTVAFVDDAPFWFLVVGRNRDASRLVERQLSTARRTATVAGIVAALACRAELDFRRGRWIPADTALTEAIARTQQLGLIPSRLLVARARLSAARGRWADCARELSEVRAGSSDLATLRHADAADALARLGSGDAAGAVDLLRPLTRSSAVVGAATATLRLWDGDLIEALVACGDDEAHDMARLLAHEPSATPWDNALRLRTAALTDPTPASALSSAITSAQRFGDIGAPFERARSELVAGDLCAMTGHEANARALYRQAAATFSALGSEPWLRIAERRQRDASRTRRDGEEHPLLTMLTSKERAVALAVAAGASNVEVASRLFVSSKTVEAHLTRVYRKLSVRNRTQLVALLRPIVSA